MNTAPPRAHPPTKQNLQRELPGVLRRVFGLKTLRPGQKDVIERVLQRRPTLAVMPTGSGKSLCYQLPALLQPGITIVVSPLLALIKDQCDKLLAHGLNAYALNSDVDADAQQAAERALADGTARIVLVTPERLATPTFQAMVRECLVSLVVVDEAHCISQWGHDFRPAFLKIGAAIRDLGAPPVLALTATAPREVVEEIRAQLNIPRAGVVDLGIWRPNLRYAVEAVAQPEDKLRRLVALVRDHPGTGIVYTSTVRAAGSACGAASPGHPGRPLPRAPACA